jgi:hypothetical protein
MIRIAIDRHYCSFPTVGKGPFFDKLRTNPHFQILRLSGHACHNDFVNDLRQQFIASDSHSSEAPPFSESE